ncbi:MAG: hypothetical protein H7070_01285 [Saprospiraceae bacterium]|nr:hypothetical protein [Pyrinomonadaceae bacterium]
MAEEKSKGSEKEQTPVWEWIIAAFGLILVTGAVGTMVYRAAAENPTPPNLSFSIDSIEPTANGYLVKFTVKNTGNRTAAGLNIEGVLKNGEDDAETSSATLTYAPANSVRQGGLFFTKDPNQFNLQIRALGYEQP